MTDVAARPASPIAAQAERRQRLLGIGLMCVALICFACLDTTAKWLGRTVDPLFTVWWRYVASVVLVSFLINPWTRPGVLRATRPVLQTVRSFLLFLSTAFNFFALQYLQLAEAISIVFSTPLLVALISGPLLGEWVGPRRLAAIGVGFIGVLIVARPGLGTVHPAILLSIAGAIAYALYAITTRILAAYDSPQTTMVYSGLAGLVLTTPALPWVWSSPADPGTWVLFVALGAFGAIGHWLLILAHARAPAPVLSPFIYTQILWMLALGYLVFGDWPDRWTLIGAGIVIASGLYLLLRERDRDGSGGEESLRKGVAPGPARR
jgi:drug/metabolite transporter (DMT)-like permease